MYGERMKDVYPFATRFEVFKFKVAHFLRKVLKVALVILILFITAKLGGYFWPNEVYVRQSIDASKERFDQKIDGLKNDLVFKLSQCESAGGTEDDGILVFDSNKKASVGQLQFQKATVIHYYKTLYNKDITGKEAILIALDTKKATDLAKDIIFREGGNVNDWLNCSRKLGLEAQANIIKKISN